MDAPAVTVVVPTRGREAYLEVALDSLCRQRTRADYELLVVDDGATDATPEVAGAPRRARRAPRRAAQPQRGPQHRPARVARAADRVRGRRRARARRAGSRRCSRAPSAIPRRRRSEARSVPASKGPRRAAAAARIRRSPRSTSAPHDREADMVWGANFAVRRSAVERIGPFDESIVRPHGDEEEWLDRLRAAGGRIQYIAAAGLDHRRTASDGRLGRLARAAYVRGRAARASDERRRQRAGNRPRAQGARRLRLAHGSPRLPSGRGDGRPLRRARGRDAAVAMSALPDPDTFLSGDSGDVTDPWRRLKRRAGELGLLGGRRGRRHPQASRPAGGAWAAARRACDRHLPARLADGRGGHGAPAFAPPGYRRARRCGSDRGWTGGRDGRERPGGWQVREPQPRACGDRRAVDLDAGGGRRRGPAARLPRPAARASAPPSGSTSPSPPRRCSATPPGRSRAAGPPPWCARPASSRSAR